MDHPAQTERTTVRAACPHDCPDTCAMVITVEDGTAVKVAGASDQPFTAGTLCTKVAHYLERTYSKDRVLHPLKRVGAKGEGRFERIGWDEALDTIAGRFGEIAGSADGPQAILPLHYAGTMGLVQYNSMDKRFFNRLGASQLHRNLCATAGTFGMQAAVGSLLGTDPERFDEAKLILIWGSNPVVSNLHLWTRCQEAKRRGARLVAIDPLRTATAEKCHQHIALIPGSDAALALAIMHVLIRDDLIDHDYVSQHTLGFDELKVRVQSYSPAIVAGICGIDAQTIEELAREYGTTRPAAIRVNFGLQRHAGGAMAVRTIACLPALTGDWRHASGGVLFATYGAFPLNTAALEHPELRTGKSRTINYSMVGDALLETRDPPIRAVYVYNSNPVAVLPESRKVIAGLMREDIFCVVHEIFLTDTTDYADIVLPATTSLEHLDIHRSYGHYYVTASLPAIAPIGEAKCNTDVFRLLAARLGYDEPCFRESDEDIARQAFKADHPNMRGIDWDLLKKKGWARLRLPERYAPFATGGFLTPSGKCELVSSFAKAQGADPLPSYVPPRESIASNPALASRYPLAFLSTPARNFLNSSFANLPRFRNAEKTPQLHIHPDDARLRGIVDGSQVRAFNDRGSLTLTARVTDRVRAGVVAAPSVWWKKLSPDGCNANELTGQWPTDMGQAAVYYDALCQVEQAASAA
jgi:anaerobic selenocysteine-containing dehydrogenase